MQEPPLGGLSPQAFLRDYWQRRPLLVRGALPAHRGVIATRALFALAARDDVESRLIEGRRGRWRVTPGPITAARLARAGARGWTLLVNGVDHHAAAAEHLLRRFAFLSEARLDDVMVSYAAPGGGVGPHFDSYDVFLIQGAGSRIWRLSSKKAFECEPQAPLRLIRDFVPDEEYLLEPGDLLYLPPGWGHDGVALDPCLTASIGFRAPRAAELSAAFLDYLHERGFRDAEYGDRGRRPSARPARIDAALLGFAAARLAGIRWRRADVAEFLGRELSTPRLGVVFRGRRRPRRLPRAGDVVLDPRTRALYRGASFFINGEALRPPPAQRAALAVLADRRRAAAGALARAGLQRIVLDWVRDGYAHLERRR